MSFKTFVQHLIVLATFPAHVIWPNLYEITSTWSMFRVFSRIWATTIKTLTHKSSFMTPFPTLVAYIHSSLNKKSLCQLISLLLPLLFTLTIPATLVVEEEKVIQKVQCYAPTVTRQITWWKHVTSNTVFPWISHQEHQILFRIKPNINSKKDGVISKENYQHIFLLIQQ